MRNLFIAVTLLISTITVAQAQVDVIFGLKGGANASTFNSDNNTSTDNFGGLEDPQTKIGFNAGITGDIKISELFGIGAEVQYSQQGTKTESTVLGQNVENKFKVDYINIPILAKIYIGGDFNIYSGIQPGFVANAKVINKVGDNESEVDLKDDNGDFATVKETDFSIPFGIGVRTKNGLSFDARYNLGTTAVFDNDNDDSDNSQKNRVFQIGLGFSF